MVLKVDMRNAFNVVSRQAVHDECSVLLPELLPWASWYYSQHPILWHTVGTISSEAGVQQGDPLDPYFVWCYRRWYLLLLRTVCALSYCFMHGTWMMALLLVHARLAVENALSIIQELGPPLGLFVNPTKCELFSLADLHSFPNEMKRSNLPHLEILGAQIGDLIFCAKIVAHKRAIALKLPNQLSEVGSVDPQVALLLLRQCGGFCKLVHLSRSTPSSLVADALSLYSDDFCQCFTECTSVDTPDNAWQQAHLSLSRGGLGLRCLSHHSSAAYIASLTTSDNGSNTNHHLLQARQHYNSLVSLAEAFLMEAVLELPGHLRQKNLSSKLEGHQFRLLFQYLSLHNRA